MVESLPPAVSLKVLELVLGSGLSQALGGAGKGRSGVKLWPPTKKGALDQSSLMLREDDIRMLDDEAGPGYTIKDGFLWGSSGVKTALRKEVETIYAEGDQLRPAAMRARNNHRWAEPDARGPLRIPSNLLLVVATTSPFKLQGICTCGLTWRAWMTLRMSGGPRGPNCALPARSCAKCRRNYVECGALVPRDAFRPSLRAIRVAERGADQTSTLRAARRTINF
jgi:hypothetical protein